tara:strand:+ start:368 stop:991 length:624 start_codon:yes stop_codon:yes gene_type:complete
MNILIGDKGNVDFDSPVKMTDNQQQKFIEFLRSIFSVIKLEKTQEFRTERIGDKFFMKEWTGDEYAALLEIEETDKVAEMLGRSWMSVDIKRGGFIPDFLAWTSEKGKDPLKDDVKSLIKDFMKEKEQELLSRREKKKELRKKQKEIEGLQDELEGWDSEKKRSQIDLAIRLKQVKNINVDEYIKSKKKEIILKIDKLKKEVGSSSS